MTTTARANRTLAARDCAHDAQAALSAIADALRAADGMPTDDQVTEFERAAADLRNTLLHAIANNRQEA